MGSLSATVTLTDTLPDEKTSTIKADTTTYLTGTDITITVMLKDKNGTALTGDAGLLTTSTVTVPNATLKSSSWRDNGDGTYTAETVSTDNQASLKLSGWSDSSTSEKYAITLGDEAPASINTQVNAYTFTQTSEEGTFPTTGFTGATFTIVSKDNKSATDYTWKSDANWVSVTDGGVKFTGTGTGSKVTITGTPTSGQGNIVKYSFTLKSWFISNGSTTMNWSGANTNCSSQSGYSLPTIEQLTNNTWRGSGSVNPTRAANAGLWSEWGNLSGYSSAGLSGDLQWSSEQDSSGYYYLVDLYNGFVFSYHDSIEVDVASRQGL
ncbi:hypothetical protein [Citrobacter koseri]|uniref:hypothetical protein n=1 Tax=Citrobacter koseri TaxID=545 RepID=UPI000DFC85DB|nr:hypothetical protein [Citrobacter koseri]STB73276.1 Invasin [Citrobacter koseri]STT23456.1 Invasin [Citrobacter koseri]